MGRLITLLVGAMLLGATFIMYSTERTTLEVREQQHDYEYQGIASNVVKSGFNRGVSAIIRDKMNVPTTFDRVTMGDGYYDLTITKNLFGDLGINVTANSGGAEYEMNSAVLFSAPLPAAVMLEDDNIELNGSGFYQLSGVDQRMPSRVGEGGLSTPVPGLMTTESHVQNFLTSLDTTKVVGGWESPDEPVNAGSITGGFDEAYFEALYQEVLGTSHSLISSEDPASREAALVSSVGGSTAGNPVIARVQGDLILTAPLSGHGLLIIEDGDLWATSGTLDWEGLVMVRKQEEDTVVVNLADSKIHGGFVAFDNDLGPTGVECVPDFAIVGDEVVIDGPFKLRMEVLGAAITYGGEYDMPVTVRIHVGGQIFEPFGSYDLPIDGNVNTGNSGVTYLWEPDNVFASGSTVSIDGKSWIRNSGGGEDGTQNNHWSVEMEKKSVDNSAHIELLQNGSSVPSVGGFMGQNSVVEFLGDYIANDAMVLDANQATSLFELGVTDTGSAAFDMQDLVVMITMIDASQESCTEEEAPSVLDVTFQNDTEIHYSSEAFAKLGSALSSIANNTQVLISKTRVAGTDEREQVVYEQTVETDDEEEPKDEEPPTGGDPDDRITMCHKGNQTKLIKRKKMGKHLHHGDRMGACTGDDDDD